MIALTEEQQGEIRRTGWPPEIINPQTGETFVLIHREMFERIRLILEREDGIAEIEEMYPLIGEILDGEEAALELS